MKILVVNGDCIQTNSSANLCHIAYIKGMVDLGHEVTLVSADSKDYSLDKSIIIPKCIKHHTYYGVTLYEKMALNRNKGKVKSADNLSIKENKQKQVSIKSKIINRIKKIVLSMYGVHGIYHKFVKVVTKEFNSNEEYDYVISLSTPVTSHLAVYKLLKSKRINAKHWIQIWEDPWFSDVYGFNNKRKIYKEEKRLLSLADKVCYVSPLTLKNQKLLFSDSKEKMYWQPLPYYYKSEIYERINFEFNHYGYFGDYAPVSRDLEPFYKAVVNCRVEVNVCGSPSNLFEPTSQIHIFPRLNLDELKLIENKTNVLVFLCNKKGGQIPGKIYQYSATNKAILFILDGTEEEKKVLKNYFSKFNRYIFCDNTVEDIERAIKEIESGQVGNVHNEPIEYFNPADTVRRILAGENG